MVALVVIFAVPALESSAFLGSVFPGEVAVLLGGVLAFQHRVSLPAVIAAAVAGAVIGDTVGYEVDLISAAGCCTAHRPPRQARAPRPGRALPRCEGRQGRFTAALRVMIPGMAGTAGIPSRTFAVYNVVDFLARRVRPEAALGGGSDRIARAHRSGRLGAGRGDPGRAGSQVAGTASWPRKVAVWASAGLLAALVGAARLYLGAHWLTDVAGGLALGSRWLFALLTATRTVAALRTAGPAPTALPSLNRRPGRC